MTAYKVTYDGKVIDKVEAVDGKQAINIVIFKSKWKAEEV